MPSPEKPVESRSSCEQWFNGFALAIGIACLLLIFVALGFALTYRVWGVDVMVFFGLAVLVAGADLALWPAVLSPEFSLGGRGSLLIILIGSILILFEWPSDVIHGRLAEMSIWQASCWLVSTLLIVSNMFGLDRLARLWRHMTTKVRRGGFGTSG